LEGLVAGAEGLAMAAVGGAGQCPTCLRSICVMTTRRDTDAHRSGLLG
jgi:hypothetical protein